MAFRMPWFRFSSKITLQNDDPKGRNPAVPFPGLVMFGTLSPWRRATRPLMQAQIDSDHDTSGAGKWWTSPPVLKFQVVYSPDFWDSWNAWYNFQDNSLLEWYDFLFTAPLKSQNVASGFFNIILQPDLDTKEPTKHFQSANDKSLTACPRAWSAQWRPRCRSNDINHHVMSTLD